MGRDIQPERPGHNRKIPLPKWTLHRTPVLERDVVVGNFLGFAGRRRRRLWSARAARHRDGSCGIIAGAGRRFTSTAAQQNYVVSHDLGKPLLFAVLVLI